MRDELSDIKVFRATCPRNCYDSCAMLVTVAGGIVRQVDGDPANPHTAGRLCSKGYSYVQRTYATNRIRHPMVQTVRGSGNWRRITWDEALDRIARKLIDVRRRHGSLLPVCLYKGTGNVGVLHNAPEAMFAAMGPHTETVFVMCWQAGNDAQRFDFGDNMTSDPGEMLKARTLLLWGVNPAWTAVHQMARIMQARDSGTRVITIDPIRTATASRSDRHLGLRPGSDGALALGMARCLLDEELYDEAFLNEHVTGWTEFRTYLRDQITVDWAARETGLPAAAIRETAVAYATARPAMIWVGFGMQRHTNALQTVRAIDALAAMTGQIGLPGTGVQYGQLANWIFGDHLRSYKGGAGQPYSGPGAIDGNRTFPNGCIGEAMPAVSDPPLEVLWVACANPVAQEPDSHAVRRALSGLDMVVVVDQFMTATAEAADIVLPATTFLEHADLHTSYWHHHVSITERAIAPLYEAKSDLAIAWALSRKLNQLSPGFTTFPTEGDEWAWVQQEWHDRAAALFGIDSADCLRSGPVRAAFPLTAWESRQFPTPSGKFELRSSAAAAAGFPDLPVYVPPVPAPPDFPIRLLTPHPPDSLHSQFHSQKLVLRVSARPVLEMHPDLAGRIGLADGDMVRVYNTRGELHLPIRLTRTVQPDTVVAYEGAYADQPYNVNLLTGPAPPGVPFPGTPFGDSFVAVEPSPRGG